MDHSGRPVGLSNQGRRAGMLAQALLRHSDRITRNEDRQTLLPGLGSKRVAQQHHEDANDQAAKKGEDEDHQLFGLDGLGVVGGLLSDLGGTSADGGKGVLRCSDLPQHGGSRGHPLGLLQEGQRLEGGVSAFPVGSLHTRFTHGLVLMLQLRELGLAYLDSLIVDRAFVRDELVQYPLQVGLGLGWGFAAHNERQDGGIILIWSHRVQFGQLPCGHLGIEGRIGVHQPARQLGAIVYGLVRNAADLHHALALVDRGGEAQIGAGQGQEEDGHQQNGPLAPHQPLPQFTQADLVLGLGSRDDLDGWGSGGLLVGHGSALFRSETIRFPVGLMDRVQMTVSYGDGGAKSINPACVAIYAYILVG